MKKVWNYINNTPLNPVILVVLFAIIGFVAMYLLGKIEYFFTCIGIGISAAVVQCALIQNQIQKDNIKIQLFDKRYLVFQSVLDSISIIKRDNWDRYLLFNENDISKQMLLIEENLYKSVQIAMCLFDEDLYLKLVNVNNAFCNVAKAYKNMLTENVLNFKSQDAVQEYLAVVNSYILSRDGLRAEECEQVLKDKFPKTYIGLREFSNECYAYLSFIEECGIIQDFAKYIIVHKLEK